VQLAQPQPEAASEVSGGVSAPRVPPLLETVGRPGIAFQVSSTEMAAREHTGSIFTLTHDPETDSIVTTGRDGKLVAWTSGGDPRQTLQLDNYYACSADVNLRQQSLLLCGVPREASSSQPSACIFLFRRANAGSAWERVGVLPRPEMKIVTAVRAIGDGSRNTFATGEQRIGNPSQRKDCVCVYDASMGPFTSLQPQVPRLGSRV
jgi:hypothetical protein